MARGLRDKIAKAITHNRNYNFLKDDEFSQGRKGVYQSAVMLFQIEADDCIFPSFGVFTVDVVPAFE